MKVKASRLGDESLAFTLSGPSSDGQPMVVSVLRIGSTQAWFAGLDISGGKPAVPEAVIVKQAEKLRAASARG